MTTRIKRLELTWIGKDIRPRLEPRILLEDESLSHARRATSTDIFDNRLIHGDNLLALKALEQEFAGKVKCIYIDPPFNTGQAFEHYDDGLEHSLWLTLIRDRLDLLHRLLAPDGTLCIHIDDGELAYLTAVADEIFGRMNRVSLITFKQGAATGHKAINPGCVTTTNFLLLYAKNKACWSPNRLYVGRDRDKRYGQFVLHRDQTCDRWEIVPLIQGYATTQRLGMQKARTIAKETPEVLDAFVLQHARAVVRLARPSYEGVSDAARKMIDRSKAQPDRIFHLTREDHDDFYFLRGERILFYESKLKTIDGTTVSGDPPTTLWDDLLSNNLHKGGGRGVSKGQEARGYHQTCH